MLLHADGFDHYGASADFVASAEYVYTTNNSTEPLRIGTTPLYIRTGAHYWDASGQIYNNWYGGRLVGGVANTLGAGAAFYFAGPPAGNNYCPFMFVSGGKDAFQASVRLNVDGSLSACSGKDGAAFGTSAPGVIVWGAYAYIEAKVICNAATGRMIVRVNNQTVLDVSGVNTDPLVTGTLTGIMCGTRNLNSSAGTAICQAISDFVIWDNQAGLVTDFCGDIRCRTIFTAGNGAAQNWVNHGDATAYQSLRHVPSVPGVDYIAAANVNDVSSFSLDAIPTNTAAIFGVRMVTQVNKASAGTCIVKPQIDSNGSLASGADINPGTGNAFYSSIIEHDPQGGGAFTYQRVNALLARVTRTA